MHILSYAFTVLTVCGIWRSMEWPLGWKQYLHWIYSLFIIVLLYGSVITQAVHLVESFTDVEQLVSTLFTLLTFFSNAIKATNIMKRRKDIIHLTGILNNKSYTSQGIKENWKQKVEDDIKSV